MSDNLPAVQKEEKGFSMVPATFEQAWKFAEIIANSDLAPKDYQKKPANVLVAMQFGHELGIQTMQALQNISVINGRPAIWGDLALALCKASPVFRSIEESYDQESKTAICLVARKGQPDVVQTFSEEDAKVAGLLGKPGPWKQYPRRMMQMRARSFALRDAFPDVLRGLVTTDEAMDYPPVEVDGVEIQQPVPKTASKVEALKQKLKAAKGTVEEEVVSKSLDDWKSEIDDCDSAAELDRWYLDNKDGIAHLPEDQLNQLIEYAGVAKKKLSSRPPADSLSCSLSGETVTLVDCGECNKRPTCPSYNEKVSQ